MKQESNKKNVWPWVAAAAVLTIGGITVYLVKRNEKRRRLLTEAQDAVSLVPADGSTDGRMATLAQQLYNAFGITPVPIVGGYSVGNFFSSYNERQELYDLAAQCTDYAVLTQYFNKLTNGALPLVEAIQRSDLSTEGKNKMVELFKADKVILKHNNAPVGVYLGEQNSMIKAGKMEANIFSKDDWADDVMLYNPQLVSVVKPL